MAGWIKMPLGMEVGLGPGDIVLDGDTAPPLKGMWMTTGQVLVASNWHWAVLMLGSTLTAGLCKICHSQDANARKEAGQVTRHHPARSWVLAQLNY